MGHYYIKRGIQLFNQLPTDIKLIDKNIKFKLMKKRCMVIVIIVQLDYIRIHTLVQKYFCKITINYLIDFLLLLQALLKGSDEWVNCKCKYYNDLS